MIIKTGTIGEWNTSTPQYYAASPGAKVTVIEDCDTTETRLVKVKWTDDLAQGEWGRQADGGYFHTDFIFT